MGKNILVINTIRNNETVNKYRKEIGVSGRLLDKVEA